MLNFYIVTFAIVIKNLLVLKQKKCQHAFYINLRFWEEKNKTMILDNDALLDRLYDWSFHLTTRKAGLEEIKKSSFSNASIVAVAP